ncbi:MAG: fused MFS/spermidine synthase [Deltaproteobacteria bacterium]|nr:fused MFS/spermidine synthase [Deltaproteobacteria bacterium]
MSEAAMARGGWRGHALVFASGMAALSWEVLWQLRASLAIGVSALGTAITLAATMGGMTIGALVAGRLLDARRASGSVVRPWRLYALLELAVGLSALFVLRLGFPLLEALDVSIHRAFAGEGRGSATSSLVQLGAMLALLFVPSAAMGATVPVFGLAARASGTSLGTLYGVNTLGASVGTIALTFGALPRLGVELSSLLLTAVNLLVGLVAWLDASEVARNGSSDARRPAAEAAREAVALPLVMVFTTGFVSFGLEVAWFRAMRASFRATTDAFAVMLVSVLVALAAGARIGRALRERRFRASWVLAVAGTLVLLATPLVERVDVLGGVPFGSAFSMCATWLFGSVVVVGPPMALVGAMLPWILDEHRDPRDWSKLYATNTIGAVLGSLVTAWVLLPALGFARSAWLLGALLVGLAVAAAPDRRAIARPAVAGAIALVLAVALESGVGRTRVIGNIITKVGRIVAFEEAVDSTVAVVDAERGERMLFIDGFVATMEGDAAHYMRWMGRLPMLLHPAPKRALVICFGTGQTANAVRREGPDALDIVDVSASVLSMAPLFTQNEGVLDDPRVHATVMDGRAWLRRTDRRYDVVTLEPMPPNFAGVNALYSREFYELVASRLEPGGIVAQWVPYHLLTVHDGVAIVATFQSVFGESLVWVDPPTQTGIVVGRRGSPTGAPPAGAMPLASSWPGLSRERAGRDLDEATIRSSVALAGEDLAKLSRLGAIITDDNQLLAYGTERHRMTFAPVDLHTYSNLAVLERFRAPAR